MKKLLLLLLSLLFLSGCTAQEQVDFAPKEENRLVIYTSHKADVYKPIVREFEERTGIWVEVVSGGTNELLKRIAQENAAPKADIMFGGGVDTLDSFREYFQSVPSAEYGNVSASFREAGDMWAPFSALTVVLVYNTKLVDPSELTGWADLMKPEFAGKIAYADPTKSGSAFTALVTGLQVCGDETMLDIAHNMKGSQFSSSGDVLPAVADGTCLVGVTLEETALKYIAEGEKVGMVYPAEGTSCIPDGTSVVLGAPHRENAIRFLEFTLSREVQQLLATQFCRRPVRYDVAAPADLIPLEQLETINYAAAWAAEHRDQILNIWSAAVKEGAK